MVKYENNAQNRREFIELLKQVGDFVNNIRDALCEPYGLSSIQAVIILDIYHNPDKTKVTDICKRLNKSTNTISPLINRLVSKGYLYKEQGVEDGRVTYIRLTDKTKNITKDISLDVSDYTWPMFEAITDEQFDNLYKCLELILEVTLG